VGALRRPAILVGFSARHADIAALARALSAPVITTYKAKGAIDERDPWSAGPASLSPVVDRAHQRELAACDGLLLIGWDPVELRDHWMPGWPDDLAVFVLDDHVVTDIPCEMTALQVGPLNALVHDLTASLGDCSSTWTEAQVDRWKQSWQAPFDDGESGPATILRAAQAGCEDDVIVSLDTGAHRITAANVWICTRADQLLQSNGFASMGYAIPAALAAASLGHRALAITGDMGLQLVMGELMTAAEQEWSITILVLVDAELSLIGLKQHKSGLPSRGVTFANPDWHRLAQSVGGQAIVARGADAVTEAIAKGLTSEGVTIVAAPIDPAAYVLQM
jgi:acetolactate synthase-1/2/3 large subunit